MPCLPTIIGLLFPRFMIVILYFFTDWFRGVFDTMLWPILGFLFAPLGTLWYAGVFHFYQGDWSTFNIIVMVIALGFDFGFLGSSAKKKKRKR